MAPKPKTTMNTTGPKPTLKKVQAAANKVVDTPIKKKPKTTATNPRTPICKDKKVVPQTPSGSTKKTMKRPPRPAHSGVPVPEKMKALLQKRLQELDVSL